MTMAASVGFSSLQDLPVLQLLAMQDPVVNIQQLVLL